MGACALALVLSLCLAAVAVAKGGEASLRVVGAGGKTLTEQNLKLKAGPVAIRTDPKATCFGAGTGGSGKVVKVPGNTALGLLARAAQKTAALRPLRITDAFDFGLGVCGIGGSSVHGKASWYLKLNHRGQQVSGDAVKVKPGDEVLWDLATSYPYPNELALVVPKNTTSGTPFTVRVFAYDEKGKRKPVAGARVTGASEPTGADGRTTVTVSGPTLLQAKHGKDIPSPVVCVAGQCPIR